MKAFPINADRERRSLPDSYSPPVPGHCCLSPPVLFPYSLLTPFQGSKNLRLSLVRLPAGWGFPRRLFLIFFLILSFPPIASWRQSVAAAPFRSACDHQTQLFVASPVFSMHGCFGFWWVFFWGQPWSVQSSLFSLTYSMGTGDGSSPGPFFATRAALIGGHPFFLLSPTVCSCSPKRFFPHSDRKSQGASLAERSSRSPFLCSFPSRHLPVPSPLLGIGSFVCCRSTSASIESFSPSASSC